MKVVLLAVIATAAASSTLAQAPVRDTKLQPTPVKFVRGEAPAQLRAIKLVTPQQASKTTPYIYKAPLATRPIKTW